MIESLNHDRTWCNLRIVKTIQFIGIVVLMIVIAAGASHAQTSSDKAHILSQLTVATKAQLPTRVSAAVRTDHASASQLALDMVVYRWLVRSSTLPVDINNLSNVLAALSKAVNDQTVNTALLVFATTQRPETTKAWIREDEQLAQLDDLQREYTTAVNYRQSYPVEAVNSLKKLVEICQKLQLDISSAVIYKELGDHYLYDMSRYREAETCYRQARWVFSTYKCAQSLAIVYDDYGTLNVETSCYAAATENYKLAAQQWVSLSNQDSSGYRYRDLAAREYMRAGDALRASGSADKALEIMSASLAQQRIWAHSAKSFSVLIENLITVADLYKDCGNIPRALDLLGEARRRSEASNDLLLSARTYEKLADVYTTARQSTWAAEAKRKREFALNKAVSTGESAILKLEKDAFASEDTRLDRYKKAKNGATAYKELGNLDKAASTWERIAAVYSKMNLIDRQISALCSAASIFDEQQKPQRSLEVRREAALAAMQANKTALAADIVENMVQAFIDIGDLNNAIDGFNELAPIIESSGKLRGSARVLEARGILLAKDGQYNAAIRDLQDAKIRYLSQIGDLWSGCEVSLKLAAAQKAAGRTADSRSTLEAIFSELESRSETENLDPTINSTKAKVVKDIIHDLTVIYLTDGSGTAESRSASAEALIQKAKRYNWLPDLINKMKADPSREVAHFARTINIFGGKQENGSVNPPGTNTLLAGDWSSYAQACWMLEKQNPVQYNALPVNPLDLFKVRNLLPKFGMVVEYMFIDSGVYVFAGRYEKSVCRETGINRQDVDKLVSELRGIIKGSEENQTAGIPVPPIYDWQSADFADIRKPLEKLYELLIAPIKADIETAQAIYFALPTELAGLPMHALIKPGNPEQPPYFLLEEYAVSYLGKDMLDNLIYGNKKQIDPSTDRLALFVDPQNNLPGAQEEAKKIRATYLNSQWYTGERATSANFLDEAEKASVLHLAVHHKIDPNPLQFELLFADSHNSSGSLTIKELSSIKNKNLSLVVLSACDSIASSDPISSGYSRAAEVFSLVGAKSVIGGMWKVSDDSASKIMGDFYLELINGKPKIEALRAAQLAAIEQKQFAHPFYWACFALYGSPI